VGNTQGDLLKQAQHVEQQRLTLLEHMSSPRFLVGFARSFVFCEKSKIKGNDHLIFTVRYASSLKKIFVVKFYQKKFDMKDAKKNPNNNPSLHFSANDFGYIDRLFMYKKLSDFSKRIKLSVPNNKIKWSLPLILDFV
jgi:hypothetical protein